VHGYSLSANRSSKTDRIAGVFMVSLHATTTEGGMIEIAGGRERGCADCLISGKNLERGVELGRGSVIQTAGDGSISITGDVPAGVAVQLRGAQIGGTDQTGSIVLRGNGGTFLGGAIQVDPQASIRTSGVVDFRPGFVHSDTSTGELPRTEVAYVDSEQLTSGAFTVDARALTSIKGTTIPGAIVLGSDQQQGAIRIDTTLNLPALAANLGALNLTLQNGAGTGGISINAPLTVGGTLALVSAGSVGQAEWRNDQRAEPRAARRWARRGLRPVGPQSNASCGQLGQHARSIDRRRHRVRQPEHHHVVCAALARHRLRNQCADIRDAQRIRSGSRLLRAVRRRRVEARPDDRGRHAEFSCRTRGTFRGSRHSTHLRSRLTRAEMSCSSGLRTSSTP
jgi:hypothetical protein